MNDTKCVHFVAICGTAMASLAGMLKERGFKVTGSDMNFYHPMDKQLASLGIEIFNGYKKENLSHNPDFAIIGNTVSADNPEVLEIISKNIIYLSFSEALSRLFLTSKIPVVVSGTHGKSTTTSLLAWIFDYAQKKPNFFVGGIPLNYNKSYKLDTGDHFIVEGDEYDSAFFDKRPKFLHYAPQIAALTSIEFDHADIYSDIHAIKKEFLNFVSLIPDDGYLVACTDYNNVIEVIKNASCTVETYGFNEKCNYKISNYSSSLIGMRFDIEDNGASIKGFETSLLGRHNLLNILATYAISKRAGIDVETMKRALLEFKGVKRRLEVRGIKNNITVFDDFAHHPTAVFETINAVRIKYQSSRIWAIFEPRTNTTRRRVLMNELANSFNGADRIIIAKVFKPEVIEPENRMDVKKLIDLIRKNNKDASYVPDTEEIVNLVKRDAKEGDVILIMSNGGFENIHERILMAIS